MEVEIEYGDAPKDVEALLLERGGSKKQYKRGGLRKVIYPPAIQKLKKAGFFKSKKSKKPEPEARECKLHNC